MHILTPPAFIHATLMTSEAAHFQSLHNEIECILLNETNDRPQFMDYFSKCFLPHTHITDNYYYHYYYCSSSSSGRRISNTITTDYTAVYFKHKVCISGLKSVILVSNYKLSQCAILSFSGFKVYILTISKLNCTAVNIYTGLVLISRFHMTGQM